MNRRTLLWAAVALIALTVELGATIASAAGEPFSPVPGWGPTRPTSALTVAIVVMGCAALAVFPRFPLAVTTIATASYLAFVLLDHELGMFLPPMIAIFGLAAQTGRRLPVLLIAGANVVAGLIWVAARTDTIVDPGSTLLAWVAFGSVLTVFFCGPVLIGEIVRTRTLLRDARKAAGPAALTR